MSISCRPAISIEAIHAEKPPLNESKFKQNESMLLRILWMVVFVVVWQVAELVLAIVVLVQLAYRVFYGAPSLSLMQFGDSLSQFLAQIGRFGTFHSDQKPWPFADWPTPRPPEGEAPHSVPAAAHPVRDEEPKL
jgi:hypothetical protein